MNLWWRLRRNQPGVRIHAFKDEEPLHHLWGIIAHPGDSLDFTHTVDMDVNGVTARKTTTFKLDFTEAP